MTELNSNQIEQFKQYLKLQGKSEKTICSYSTDIKQYFEQYPTLSKENILNFKSQFKEASTINHKLTSIKQYNEYLISINEIDGILILSSYFVKKQKKGNPLKVTDNQIKKFMERINNSNDIRNIAIVYLLANTGIRREESTNIKLSDINFKNKKLIIYKGKGEKQREILLNDNLIKILNVYIEYRNGINEKGKPNYKHAKESEYLFVSRESEKLDVSMINRIFNKYKGKDITPHQLRHYYSTIMVEKGKLTLPELQRMLGHSDSKSTEIYTHPREESIQNKINEVWIGV